MRIETQPVPAASDQVDIIVHVTEQASGSLFVSAGYAQDRGALLNVGITQENLFGTGNAASFTFNNSSSQKEFSVSYTNPYFRPEGISRRLFARYEETDGRELNISDYSTDVTGVGVNFGIPFTEYDRFHVGLSGERIDFVPGLFPSEEVADFAEEISGNRTLGGDYLELLGTARWSRDSRDRRILPTQGSYASALAEVTLPGSKLGFYRTRLSHQRFLPVATDWILMAEGELGYGGGYGSTESLPLTSHFFAGGARSVRGFESNSLGPRDSKNDPKGGDFLALARAELIVPLPFVDKSTQFRLTGFLDAGNVFESLDDFDAGELRYSTGFSTIWFAGIGVITTSWGFPLNDEDGDKVQRFQFTIGTTF